MKNLLPQIHVIGTIGEVEIATTPVPEIKPGRQLILLQANPAGRSLAADLFPEQLSVIVRDGQAWIPVPHSERADAVLVELVDVAAEIRRQAPQLVQLRLLSPELGV